MDEILYLELDDLLDAHKRGYTEFSGGMDYSYDESCVEKRINEPQGFFWGVEQYPGLFKKAAVYMHRIISSHCFSDGNKRAGFLATEVFLGLNGYEFDVTTDELFDFCLKIANHETRPELHEVESWIKEHVIPFQF